MKLQAIFNPEFVSESSVSTHESYFTQLDERTEAQKKSFRNFVAKHARTVNKAGAMADKKNDYKRKAKHVKKFDKGEQ